MCSCVCTCMHICTCMPFLWKTGHWMPGHLLSFGTRWAMTSTHGFYMEKFYLASMNCKKNFCKLLLLKSPTCRATYMTRNYYVIQCTLHMSVLFWRIWIILAKQGYVVVPCPRQREMEKKVVFSVKCQYLLVMWHHGRQLSSWSLLLTVTKCHIDHCRLMFVFYLSLPVNLPIVTLWAAQLRWSINKTKCRIWEIIN